MQGRYLQVLGEALVEDAHYDEEEVEAAPAVAEVSDRAEAADLEGGLAVVGVREGRHEDRVVVVGAHVLLDAEVVARHRADVGDHHARYDEVEGPARGEGSGWGEG